MDNTNCSENRIKNDEKQNSNNDNNHEYEHAIIKDLKVLKKLNDKILSNLNNYLSK